MRPDQQAHLDPMDQGVTQVQLEWRDFPEKQEPKANRETRVTLD